MRAEDVRLISNKEIRNFGKIVYIKTYLKMAGGRMHTPHPNPLGPLLAIIYRNHQKSLAYFSHLAPLILFLFTKRQSERWGGGTWRNASLNTFLYGIPAYNWFVKNARFY